ncbi:hypothetical protein L1049_000614 [Liquidambar formosana]|uniref:Sugar phosphate transporter domain-containing protein n=1 Tax=Liquidambar formosana TaxID=63359 RepID=A0AAP0NBS6_LIQFO
MVCFTKQICFSKQTLVPIAGSDVIVRQKSLPPTGGLSFLPSLSVPKQRSFSISTVKPLHISATTTKGFGSYKESRDQEPFTCRAYEAESIGADRGGFGAAEEVGRGEEVEDRNLLCDVVAVAHTIGHVAATVSMSKVAVSFTHIIKSGEPAFSVLVSRFLLGETFPVPVYLSLIPIIGGCSLAALTELNFNMIGFMGAMISNLAFVFRNIFSKRGMKGKSVSGMNYYACLSILSLLILTPFAIAVEGPQMWAAGWQNALSEIGPQIIWWVAAQSVFYHLYNQVSYMSLDEISPLTFSIGNTMKRISVIVSSIIIFHTPVQPINALGAAIAILGTFLYSQAKQ